MVRRDFLAGRPVLPALAADWQTGGASAPVTPQIYEWRQYSLRTGTQPRRLADYLQNALIPALNRLGPTAHHRRTFAPVLRLLEPSLPFEEPVAD